MKNKDNLSEEKYPINKIFTVEKKDIKKFDRLVKKNLRRQKNEIKYDFSKMRQTGKEWWVLSEWYHPHTVCNFVDNSSKTCGKKG